MQLRKQHALVTGGSKRVGRAIAERLIQEGMRVTVTYRKSKHDADDFLNWAKGKGEAHAVSLDLTSTQSIETAVTDAVKQFGPVSLLVNAASDFYPTKLRTVTEEDWDALHASNVKGHFFVIQSVLKEMKAGCIINICDIHVSKPLRNFSPYASSKGGLWTLTRNLAAELAPHIRVNSISPGPVLLPDSFSPEQRTREMESTLLKRIGSPTDIAEAVLFLCENDYLTGMDLKVDGGASLVGA